LSLTTPSLRIVKSAGLKTLAVINSKTARSTLRPFGLHQIKHEFRGSVPTFMREADGRVVPLGCAY
jgi:hypothetical protein